MKKKFSTAWNSSKQPRKQRKYLANAPIHLKRKLVNVNLSKDLRKKHGIRSISLRKNDVVKIMRGKFKNKTGKVVLVKIKMQRVEIENIQVKKQDGSRVNVGLKPSNIQIIELNLEDKKRNKFLGKSESSEKKVVAKKEAEGSQDIKKTQVKEKSLRSEEKK